MITPELLTFIRDQLAAGTSREQVADMLLSNGWSAADITNALSQAAPVQPVQPTQPIEPARPVEPVQSMQPMQAAATLPVQTYTEPIYRPVAQSSMQPMQSVQSMQPESAHLAQAQTQAQTHTTVSHSGWTKSFMVLAGIVVAFAAGWIANQGVTNSRMQIQSVRDAASNQPSPAIQDQASESDTIAPDAPATAAPAASANPASATSAGTTQSSALAAEKDCGTTNGKTPYASDPVLACMGAAALSCSNARATISIGSGGSAQPSTSTLKITNPGSGGACSFTVVPAPAPNASGASASAPSISCPLSIVKASDDFLSSATPTWKNPTKTDPNKYAGEIYYYGAMGVFIQNNFSEAKIRAAGCTGDFIKTYIAEHAKLMKMQTH